MQPVQRGKRGADAQGLGRSKGGLSSKIHLACDALGLPLKLIVTPGNRNDITMAHHLIEGIDARAFLADKGYDADHLLQAIEKTSAKAVIPPRRDRKIQRKIDKLLYKEASPHRKPIRQTQAIPKDRNAL